MPGRIIFWAAPLLVPVLFFIVWESMATLVGNSLILPPLEEIGALLAHPLDNVIAMGTLAGNIGISLVRVLCGYAAAVLLGVPLGVVNCFFKFLYVPIIYFLPSVCKTKDGRLLHRLMSCSTDYLVLNLIAANF